MSDFVPGQRWFNSAEPELGLGIVIEVEHRRVTMLFMAVEDSRVYAIDNTPLTRIRFKAGEIIQSQHHGPLTVHSVTEHDGVLTYEAISAEGERYHVPERELDHVIQLSTPVDRLFSEQIDKNQWFELRHQLQTVSNHFQHSDLYGLSGSRTALLPHQLYIAHEVGKRYAPRVLLADEVGLGKTIEAGMILHQQLLRDQVQRVLVIVPETLQHQWLVEMLRRFNLAFTLLDRQRLEDEFEESAEHNPFLDSQWVISNLDVITDDMYQTLVLAGDWDMLIVDEAHHLVWDPEQSQPAYQMIERLAENTSSVLLLTATPEQLGRESHFARLRLLDANRFDDYQTFLDEEHSYQPIANLIDALMGEVALSDRQIEHVKSVIKDQELLNQVDASSLSSKEDLRQRVIRHLLDQQGTGRVLFRNTRVAIQGFPRRNVCHYSLPRPDAYNDEQASRINIEADVSDWTQFDPRLPWLVDLVKAHAQDKFLLITSAMETALDISEWLRVKHGIHAPVFHEQMSILERDRVAAFFADEIDGCQILLCSEIGGEGRNFQFAHHLVLFELPLNPDLLEQRIGRIDRIGQGDDIYLHVPTIENTAQVALLAWYHQGLNALQAICPAATKMYQQYSDSLQKNLAQRSVDAVWLTQVEKETAEINQQLQDGRDRLLEINSFDKNVATHIMTGLQDQQNPETLQQTMELVFDCYGVDHEVHSDQAYVIKPSSSLADNFPGLDEEGLTITYDRATALKYENISFLTWEHPMVIAATDMVLVNDRGNTAVGSFSHSLATEGLLFVECLYRLDVSAQFQHYLPGSLIRVLLGEDMKDYSKAISSQHLQNQKEFVKLEVARQIVRAKRTVIEKLIRISQAQADKQRPDLQLAARHSIDDILGAEVQRLESLASLNPNVRQQEIDYFRSSYQQSQEALQKAVLRLDAIRILVAT